MLKAYPISAKEQLNTQCNLALAKMKLTMMFKSDEAPSLSVVADCYHHSASIRRDTSLNDIAWEKFFYDTNRLSEAAAALEWHRSDGVRPEMGVIFSIKPSVTETDITEIASIYESKFKLFNWTRKWEAYQRPMLCCISLMEVPDKDLTDFLSIIRSMSLRSLEFVAIAASPLTWKD